MKRTILLLMVVLTANCHVLFGWGARGHDIVCYIAEQNLTKRTKKAVSEILDGKSIVYYASWMDNIQNSPYWKDGYEATQTWHYANVDEGFTYETMRKEPKGDVLTGIEFVVKELKSGQLNDSMRADYLKMLVHMVGDMHCPMHAGWLSDRGGNNRQVRFFGQPTNLHAVWDTRVIESAHQWSYTEWQKQLDRCNKKEIKQITAGTIYSWFDGTVAAAAILYENTPAGTDLRYQYVYDFSYLAERQLLYGGYRLAAILNDIFG